MDKLLKKLKKNAILTALLVVIVLFSVYLFSEEFRCFLEKQNIDPNFIIGFLTVLALLLSLIQASHDRRYAYNLKLIESIEEKGLRIIGKLLGIKQKSATLLATLQSVKTCLDNKVIFVDTHLATDKTDVDSDMELVTSYIHTYFNELSSDWNDLIEKLRTVGNYAGNAIINYTNNLDVIQKHGPHNVCEALDNLPSTIELTEKVNNELDELTSAMADKIVKKINETRMQVKAGID